MRLLRALPAILLAATLIIFGGIDLLYYGRFVKRESGTDKRPPSATPITIPTGSAGSTAAQRAETDDSDALPGRFVPTQGRNHLRTAFSTAQHVDYCPEHRVSGDCYASNPPTSGLHLNVQRNVRLEDGYVINIPPDPDVYAVSIPRESIPHLEEHVGVYVGYRCEGGDACPAAVESARRVVDDALSRGKRVVMSPDPDLEGDTLAAASWTRVDVFAAGEYSDGRLQRFIDAHSCRFDPEQLCKS